MAAPAYLCPPTAALQAPAYNEWQRQQQAKVNLNQPVGVFKDMVLAWPQRLPGMDVEVKAMNQNNLPAFVFTDGVLLGRTALHPSCHTFRL
jgi:poly(A) polymerase Pap1